MPTLPAFDPGVAALVIVVFRSIVLPAFKILRQRMRDGEVDATKRTKVETEAEVAASAEWRRLYEKMGDRVREAEAHSDLQDARINEMELKLQEDAAIKIEKNTLERRVAFVEQELQGLREAFEYLAHEVELTHPQAVNIARQIAAGKLKQGKT